MKCSETTSLPSTQTVFRRRGWARIVEVSSAGNGKAKLVRHLEGGRQNHAERLAAKLLIAPAISLFKCRINRHDLPKRICEHKRAIPLLQLIDAGKGAGITTSRFWPIRRLPISLGILLLLNQASPRNGKLNNITSY